MGVEEYLLFVLAVVYFMTAKGNSPGECPTKRESGSSTDS